MSIIVSIFVIIQLFVFVFRATSGFVLFNKPIIIIRQQLQPLLRHIFVNFVFIIIIRINTLTELNRMHMLTIMDRPPIRITL